jgi:hypothetical protein
MANSLTNDGEEFALFGDGVGDGSIARLATAVRLFDSTSTPAKNGTGFVEVANGNGYVTGGQAITVADWTFSVVSMNGQIVLDDFVWTAVGGNISNIKGAYITDASGNELAWWERTTAVTLTPGDSLTVDDLTIRLT